MANLGLPRKTPATGQNKISTSQPATSRFQVWALFTQPWFLLLLLTVHCKLSINLSWGPPPYASVTVIYSSWNFANEHLLHWLQHIEVSYHHILPEQLTNKNVRTSLDNRSRKGMLHLSLYCRQLTWEPTTRIWTKGPCKNVVHCSTDWSHQKTRITMIKFTE